jgi:hypothetical protein
VHGPQRRGAPGVAINLRQKECDEPFRRALRPRIARIWRGWTTTATADEYARYHYTHITPLDEAALLSSCFGTTARSRASS